MPSQRSFIVAGGLSQREDLDFSCFVNTERFSCICSLTLVTLTMQNHYQSQRHPQISFLRQRYMRLGEESIAIYYFVKQTKLHTIGKGFCGTVWAQDETGFAFKREDGGPGKDLENDFKVHKRLITSLDEAEILMKNAAAMDGFTNRARTSVIAAIENTNPHSPLVNMSSRPKLDQNQFRFQIPLCYHFILAEDSWWVDKLRYLPDDYTSCRLLV